MPLLDHFIAPLEHRCPWTSLLSSWAAYLVARLNRRWLPEDFVASCAIHISPGHESVLMNFGAFRLVRSPQEPTPPAPNWIVPPPAFTAGRIDGDYVEIRLRDRAQCWSVPPAVVSFVTPTNKETPQQRRAYLSRCLAHLYQGSALVILDVVTPYPHCLFDDLLDLLHLDSVPRSAPETRLFAAAFRPVSRGDRNRTIDPDERKELDVWVEPVRVGYPLPTMPLRLIYDDFVPVEFEAVYLDLLHTLRIIDPD